MEMTFAVQKVYFQSDKNCYAVVRATAKEPYSTPNGVGMDFPVVGTIPLASIGKIYRANGEWCRHPKYGIEFSIHRNEMAYEVMPKTESGIIAYLASEAVKGIGERYARAVVERFGLDTPNVIENSPERLTEISGIGEKRAEKIADSWNQSKKIQALAQFLIPYGITMNKVMKFYDQWGDSALYIIQKNPYRITEVPGIGFLIADVIAQKLGVPKDAPIRIQAGILYAIKQQENLGNTCTKPDELLKEAEKLLCLPGKKITPEIKQLCQQDEKGYARLYKDHNDYYSSQLYWAEKNAASYLSEMIQYQNNSQTVTDEEIHEIEREEQAEQSKKENIRNEPFQYNEGQKNAIRMAAKHPIMILTGGPGTGKTTVLKAILKILCKQNRYILLAAPTGRAAKRMKESIKNACGEGTGVSNPVTIHRLLEYNPERGFMRNAENTLEGSVLVVDECSMLDISLFSALISACPPNIKLLLIGDVDQLPSIGPGTVLADLINSGKFPVARLTETTRQSKKSGIVINAKRINQGKKINPSAGDGMFQFIPIEENGQNNLELRVQNIVTRLMTRVLPNQRYSVDDIQILAPKHNGLAGVDLLNRSVKTALKGPIKHIECKEKNGRKYLPAFQFEPGDRVMQTKNDYNLNVYNGDIGKIYDFIEDEDGEKYILIQYPDSEKSGESYRYVKYRKQDMDNVVPAYACTIHKSQGSEFPVVIIPLLNTSYIMLQRNLLYTAVTRGKKRVILVGQGSAINQAIRTVKASERHGHLKDRIIESTR